MTFRFSQHGALGSKRTCVCAEELFIRTGSTTEFIISAAPFINSNIQIFLHKSEVAGWWKLLSESFLNCKLMIRWVVPRECHMQN